jgi:hypothetical protein
MGGQSGWYRGAQFLRPWTEEFSIWEPLSLDGGAFSFETMRAIGEAKSIRDEIAYASG